MPKAPILSPQNLYTLTENERYGYAPAEQSKK